MDSDDGSDIPEEITIQQGIKQDEEIRKVQRDSKKRVASEGKERRRKWAQRKTQRQLKDGAVAPKTLQSELHQDEHDETLEDTHGMLPQNIVNLLAIREKKIFHSDSENETADAKPSLEKKKQKRTGSNVMILKELPPAHCLQNSVDFLKKRKMNVQRSDTVLKNSKQALRLLSSRGLLK